VTEKELIDRCCDLIVEKLHWGSTDSWSKAEYNSLSELLFSKSKINVSIDTLRRLFGKIKPASGHYNPHISTKNALVVYLGFDNWMAFKTFINNENLHLTKDNLTNINPKKSYRKGLLSIVILLLVIASGITFLFIIQRNSPTSHSILILKASVEKGHSPLKVSFEYDLNGYKDSVFIDFDDNASQKLVFLSNRTGTLHKSFIIPKLYKIKLVDSKRKVLTSIHVLVESDNWELLGYNGAFFLVPLIPRNGMLFFLPDDFVRYNKSNLSGWSLYQYIKKIGIDADNFAFETRVINNEKFGGMSCFDAGFEINGDSANVGATFLQKDCSSYVSLKASEVYLSGETTELSAFEQNTQNWSIYRLEVNKGQAQYYFNGAHIYTINYKKPLGNVVGMQLFFKGCGAVDYVKLYNDKRQLVYDNQFNN
jgi:hypothetical protein